MKEKKIDIYYKYKKVLEYMKKSGMAAEPVVISKRVGCSKSTVYFAIRKYKQLRRWRAGRKVYYQYVEESNDNTNLS